MGRVLLLTRGWGTSAGIESVQRGDVGLGGGSSLRRGVLKAQEGPGPTQSVTGAVCRVSVERRVSFLFNNNRKGLILPLRVTSSWVPGLALWPRSEPVT